MQEKQTSRLGKYMVIALCTGIIAGIIVNSFIVDHTLVDAIFDNCNIISSIFIRLIKMIVSPLIFFALVSGIWSLNDHSLFGRLFIRSMLLFVVFGFLSLLTGMIFADILQPGIELMPVFAKNLANVQHASTVHLANSEGFSLKSLVDEIISNSIVDSFAHNKMIQIVLFGVLAGIAGISLGEKLSPVIKFSNAISLMLFKITNYIMYYAPIAVFASIMGVVGHNGISILSSYLLYMAEFFAGLGVIWFILIIAGSVIVGFAPTMKLMKAIAAPVLLSFVSSSSEVSYPLVVEKITEYGIAPKITNCVLTLGYSFNLIGSMFNCSFATLFLIQLYGYHMSIAQQVGMLLLLMITSKGIAGIPRVSLVIVATTLVAYGYSDAGIIILLPIDSFLDMGRSATNVFSNAMNVLLVNKWENRKKI
jgi:Na+/H+-dicarboxylate symporter